MTRALSLMCSIVVGLALAGCSDASRRPAPVEDRTSQSKPPTTSTTLARPSALPAVATQPPVAIVKPLGTTAEPEFIPLPVPEGGTAQARLPAPTPDGSSPPAPSAPANALAANAPAPGVSSAAVAEARAIPGEAGKQYRPSAAVAELLGKARTLEQKRDFPGAIAILERGLQIAPNDAMLWHQLARMRFANGEAAQAKRLAERSNSLARDYPTITAGNWMLIAQVEKLAGHADAAARASSNAQSAPASP